MTILKPNTSLKKRLLPSASKWHWALLIAGLLAIAAHFALRWVAVPNIYTVADADIPLLVVIVLGGVPIVLQILLRLIRGDFGADLLAVLALVTGAWLGEYLAAVLIILMLAGGKALEAYAMM